MEPAAFTDLIGCRVPIQLASMGGPVGTPELAAAVSEAGGLGMIPNPSSAAEVDEVIGVARALTSRAIGVGFLVPFVAIDAVEAAAALSEAVEFFYGIPDPEIVRVAKVNHSSVGWQVGSADEAAAAEKAGCDYVVAQGTEAGGHIRGNQPLDEILEETLARVGVPVVAAGGVGSNDRVARLLETGASAIRSGTRFVAAVESGAHPDYVAALIDATGSETVITETFSAGWPDAPHRVLRSAVTAADAFTGEVVARIGSNDITRFAPQPPTKQCHGTIEAMALYCGESVDHVHRVQPAADIVAELAADL